MSLEEAWSWQVEVYHSAVARGEEERARSSRWVTCVRLFANVAFVTQPGPLGPARKQQRRRRNQSGSDPCQSKQGCAVDQRHRGNGDCITYVAHGTAVQPGGMTDGSQWCEASTGLAELANNDITYTLRKACVDAQAPLLPCSPATARSSFPEVPARSSLYHPLGSLECR